MDSDQSKFERLRILGFENEKCPATEKPLEFQAYLNPSEVTYTYENEFDASKGVGATNAPMKFTGQKSGDLSLTLFLDGTGANGRRIDVQAKVEEFREVTGYTGEKHRPRYLQIGWGKLPPKRCVLKTLSVVYKLFGSNGVPLRAIMTATFIGNSDEETRVAKEGRASPDLTKVRRIEAGQTLPALCAQIYGNPRLYLRVAAANGLNGFRELTPGTEIYFPPLVK